MPTQGHMTCEFGKWLTANVNEIGAPSDYVVFYDHGDSQEENVVAIKGFCGDEVCNKNRLADVDVMIAKPSGRIVLLIEIEERHATPKKIIGDAATLLMCTKFAVRKEKEQKTYTVDRNSRLLIALILPDHGDRQRKVSEVLAPRFKSFSGFKQGVRPGQVEFLSDGSIKELREKLECRVKAILRSDSRTTRS